MKTERNRLIDAIIASTLSYKDDVVCLSDHIDANRGTLIYYVREFFGGSINDEQIHTYTSRGRIYMRLLIDAPRMEVPDISDLSIAVRDKYQNTASFGFNAENDRIVSDLYETIGTAPPKAWVSKPFTLVKCAEPRINLRIDGHITLTEVAEALEGYPPQHSLYLRFPNGPAPVTIRHITEMVQDDGR